MDLDQLEAFALADDRDAAIEQLIPGSESHYYYSALLAQQRGELDKVDELIAAWRKRHGSSSNLETIASRQLVLRLEGNTVEVADELRRRLYLDFSHQREVELARGAHPSALDAGLIAGDRLASAARTHHPGSSAGFTDRGLARMLAEKDLDAASRHHMLSRLGRPDHPGLAEHIHQDLVSRRTSFGDLSIHRLLLPEQLRELAARNPEIENNPVFVDCQLLHLQPGADDAWRDDAERRIEVLDRFWERVSSLGPAFNSLKAHVLFHRLAAGRELGQWSLELFRAYLATPRAVGYLASKFRKDNKSHMAQLGADFSHATGLAAVGNDQELVRDYLRALLTDADDFGDLSELLDLHQLERWFAEIKILAATGDLERWHQLYGDDTGFATLRDRVDIELVAQNKPHLAADEPIALEARIKNVETLVVNVFEINALGYALRHRKLPDTSIDLDGLVASKSETHTYDEPPFRSVTRRFEFPDLDGPGVFVVELLGGGISSRALVTKGSLHMTERVGASGHVFSVYDEQNRHVDDAVMYIGSTEFAADEHGEIRVPFTTRTSEQRAVLAAHGRVSVATFHHRAERYNLSAGIFVAREALIAGNTATIIARPTLSVSGTEISRTLLTEPTLVIETTDRRGVSARKEIRDLDLTGSAELTGEFRVPENLASVSIRMTATVRSVSEQTDVELSNGTSFSLNAIDASQHIDALHLCRDGADYVAYALGKNGEPRPDLAVALTIRHRDFTDVLELTLQTDENGSLRLGALADIDSIEARAPSGVIASWQIARDVATVPGQLHIGASETITLPVGEATSVSVLERRGRGFVADHSRVARIESGALFLTDLPAGDHLLTLVGDERQVHLRVVAGERHGAHLLGERRVMEASRLESVRVQSVEIKDKSLVISVAGHGPRTRVHLEATRFLGSRTLWHCIGATVAPPRLRGNELGRSRSYYVSGRELGDEVRYVLERRTAAKTPGSAVGRPALLLNPWARDATDTDTLVAGGGGAYPVASAASMGAAMAPPPASAPQGAGSGSGDFANVDFLANPALVAANLPIGADGTVRVSRDAWSDASEIRVLVIDDDVAITRHVSLPATPLERRDLRLDDPLDPTVHVSQQRQISERMAGEALVIRDIASATVDVVDTISRVHSLYCSLSSNTTLTEFGFVTRWPDLPEKEQRRLYSKYACHELHLFLRAKDQRFFSDIIAPYLESKHHKTFLDDYFTGAALEPYLEPWRYARLNTLERILLAGRLADTLEATRARVRDVVELVPRNLAAEKALFDAVIGGGALEADTLGIVDAAKEVRGARKKKRAQRRAAPAAKAMAADAFEDFDDEMPEPEEALAEEGYGGEMMRSRDIAAREESQLFRAPARTKEWAENNYWHRRPGEQTADLIRPNRFWLDYALHDGTQPFLSPHFAEATGSFTEMLAALAVLDLPFAAGSHKSEYDGAVMNLEVGTPALVFHKQIAEAPERAERVPVLVSQNYFRADDRYRWDGGEQLDKYVTGEMLSHVVYLCQVVLTNPTSSPKKLQVLLQTPEGSLPVAGGMALRGEPIDLSPYGTQSLEYAFYFPAPGTFAHYGAQVTLDEELIASVESATLEVVKTLSTVDTTSWAHVSQHGDDADVLAFLETANLARIDLGRIAWRMREEPMFTSTLETLERHRVFDGVLWSYALFHGDVPRILQFLRLTDELIETLGPNFEGPLALDPVWRGRYEHLEYDPLVNARAHRLGSRRKIANKALEAQYRRALERLCHTRSLGDAEWLEVAYYLFVQDRVAEALAALARVSEDLGGPPIDYMRAYAALAAGELDRAAQLAQSHADHPVDRWRQRFEAVRGALARAQGEDPIITDRDDRRQAQDKMAAGTPSFELVGEDRQVTVRYRRLERCRVNYYLMDTELLFSRQPFLRQASDRFSMIRPNTSSEIELGSGEDSGEHVIEIPAALHRKNLVIEVEARGMRQTVVHYAHDLSIQLIERFGQLRVGAQGDGKPIAGAYVKVYARKHDGSVEFYKDGYTDITGSFDYASLSTDDLDRVERFALLLLEPDRGSVVREAEPPPR